MKKIILLITIINFLFIHTNAQNNYLDFDGTDDYVEVSPNSSLNMHNSSLTVEFWMKGDESLNFSVERMIIDRNFKISTTSDWEFKFDFDGSNAPLFTTIDWSDGHWHHVAGVFDNSNDKFQFYFDGVLINEASETNAPGDVTMSLYIASHEGSSSFSDIMLDEIRIWDDARTKNEIRANMYKELAGTEDNLVAYYKFNETTGSTADNAEGTFALDGTLTNMDDSDWITSPTFFGPKNCLDFDGSDDYVTIPDNTAHKPAAVSVEAWIYINGSGTTKIGGHDLQFAIFKKNSRTSYFEGYTIYYNESTQEFACTVTSSSGTQKGVVSSTVSLGEWNHLALVADNTDLTLYFNGISQGTVSTGFALDYGSSPLYFGRTGDGSWEGYLNGKVDEVRIWNVKRTAQQIHENMCNTLTGTEDNLVAYYNLDNTTGTTLQDFSTNTNDGTLTNMVPADDWVSSSSFNTWLNTNSTNWATDANWSDGSAPTSTDNVGIHDYTTSGGSDPVIGAAAPCNHIYIGENASLTLDTDVGQIIHGKVIIKGNVEIKDGGFWDITRFLRINPNGNLTIKPGGKLTVDEYTDNNGTFTIESDATKTGSYIPLGTVSGNLIFKRYVDEIAKSAKWHYVSAPVAGQALNTTWMTNNSISFSDPAYQFFRWDEDTDYWIYFDYTGSAPEDFGDDTFIEARGYALTRTGAGELSFTGTVRTSDVTYAATYTTAKGEGSNLVGNPFTSAIGVTSEATSTQNFIAQNSALLDDSHEALYIWDEAAGYNGSNQDYKVISNGAIGEHTRILQDYIQPGQAFIVEVVSGGGDLAFNENMQVHATVDFYKNTKELFPSVELIVENNEFFNSTAIGFNENMSFGLDPSYDVGKMKGNPDIALYTRLVEDNGIDFAIQALPPLNTEKVEVKVGLDVSQAGDYNFKLIESENLDKTTSIKLEDKETGELIDFREIEEYSFNISEAGEIRERFVLHFNNATGIEDQTSETENIRFYVYNNKLYIIDKELKNGTIQLFNMVGQPVMEKQYSEAVNTIDLNLSEGYYVVRIITDKTTVSGKVYVE